MIRTALRSSLERISRRVVFPRRLPKEFGGGVVYVSPGAGGLKYWKKSLGEVDPDVLQSVRDLVSPGDVVWDVGANVGLFAFAAAHRAGPSGKVVAIDADVENASLLTRSARAIDRSASAEVQVFPAAISDGKSQVARFAIATRSKAASSLAGFGGSQTGGVREERLVPAISLDALARELGAPQAIKIDVEGAERMVLEGALAVLGNSRPRLSIEVWERNTDFVTETLKKSGYELFDGSVAPARRQPVEAAVWNTLALPR